MRDASTRLHRANRFVALTATALALLAACALGGCASSGGPASGAFAMASGGAATVTFESIDGPPPEVFRKLVANLDAEAQARKIPVVARSGPATYRVRSYLSAQVVRGRTMIAWVWDVYDGSQQRALRLSGEEPAGKPGRDAWAAADDLVLRKIAQAGLAGLSGMINGTPAEPAPPAAAPGKRGPAVAAVEPADRALAFNAH